MIVVSPSQVETFRDCHRKWAFKHIDGLQEPDDASKSFGTDGHTLAENWLRSGIHPGESVQGQLIQKAIKPDFLPNPDARLIIEEKFEMGMLRGHALMTGKADCIVPPGVSGFSVPTLIDHKFTSDLRYALNEDPTDPEKWLGANAQRLIYGRYMIEHFKVEYTLARWIYYGSPRDRETGERKVGSVRKVEHVLNRIDAKGDEWLRIATEVEQMLYYRESGKKALDIEPTGAGVACGKYRGCPFKDKCNLSPSQILSAHFKQFNKPRIADVPSASQAQENSNMDLLAKMRSQYAQASTPTEPTAQPPRSDGGPVPAAVSPADPVPQAPAVTSPAAAAPAETPLERMRRQASQVNPPAVPSEQATQAPPAAKPEIAAAAASPAPDPAPAAAAAQTGPAPTTEKPKRGRKSAALEKSGKFVLFVDALYSKPPDGVDTYQFTDLIIPLCKRVCEENKVGHIGLIDFQKGYSALAQYLDQAFAAEKPDGVVLADSNTAEFKACAVVLAAYADVIVRGA